MNALIRHIEYLISRTDCVIIPGIGAVLAHYECAQYEPDTMSYLPPRRVYSFNSALSRTDGALAASLSRAEHIPFEQAAAKISQQAEALGRQLRIQGEAPLGRVGILKLADDGVTPLFEPFTEDRLSSLTSWLPRVAHRSEAEATPVWEESPIRVRPYNPWARFAKIAASIAILICVCFVASTPISVQEAARASFSPDIRRATEQAADMPQPADMAQAADIQQPGAEAQEDAFYVDAHTDAQLVIYGSEEAIADEVTANEENYLIIVGSFSTADDARRHISATGNEHLRYIEKSGRFRVYAYGFETESEAYAKIASDPALAGSWVCKK